MAAYHTALSHSPGFVRCRYNLGVSCINLKSYAEAVEHFLTALNFQDRCQLVTCLAPVLPGCALCSGRGPGEDRQMSESIWNSLRLAVNLLQRRDLGPLLDNRDLATLSAGFGVERLSHLD